VLFSFAKKEEWVAVNPVEYVTSKEFEQEAPGILDLDQIKALLKACVERQPDFVPALTLALFAGLRPESELWHIERKHIDLAKGEIDVHRSKSKGSTRFVKPEPVLLSWLKQYLPESSPKRNLIGPTYSSV
jgi:site-specific recombinase XerD